MWVALLLKPVRSTSETFELWNIENIEKPQKSLEIRIIYKMA